MKYIKMDLIHLFMLRCCHNGPIDKRLSMNFHSRQVITSQKPEGTRGRDERRENKTRHVTCFMLHVKSCTSPLKPEEEMKSVNERLLWCLKASVPALRRRQREKYTSRAGTSSRTNARQKKKKVHGMDYNIPERSIKHHSNR